MAIQSTDQAIAALATGQSQSFTKALDHGSPVYASGDTYSLWWMAGAPAGGPAPVAAAQEVHWSGSQGAATFTNPTGGKLTYVGRFNAASNVPGTLVLYDRLWSGGFNANSVATTTFTDPFTGVSPATTRRLASGAGAELWIELYVPSSNGTGSITVTYTNQAGSTGRTTTFTIPTLGGNRLDGMFRVPLSTASSIIDTGVRRVESVQVTAVSGSTLATVVMVNRLAEISVPVAAVGQVLDLIGTGLPQVQDNAAVGLFWLHGGATTAPTFQGSYKLIQG